MPAELHAQEAQRAATSAQQQLQTTQSQLTDAANTAAVAQLEKQQAFDKVENAKTALEGASTTISEAIAGTAQPVESFDVGSGGDKTAPARTDLLRAKSEIDRALLQLRSVSNTK